MKQHFRNFVRAVLPPRAYYYLRDRWASNEIHCIHRVLRDNPTDSVMIDVGAHIGGSLISFALDGWTVHAFEPDDLNRSKLIDLCHRASLSKVAIDSRAVSDKKEKSLDFYRSDVSTGISGLSVFHRSHAKAQTVSTTTLTDYCVKNGINKVDFLKIDTEGWDYFVLKGFPFARIRPRVILAEFEDHKTIPLGYKWEDMARFLTEKGYKVVVSEWCPVAEYGANNQWRNISTYPCTLLDTRATGNLVAMQDKDDMQKIINLMRKYLKASTRPLDSVEM